MLKNFPTDYEAALDWGWDDWQPHYATVLEADLTDETLDAWLKAWTRLSSMLSEVGSRLRIAMDLDTEDEAAEKRYKHFTANVLPPARQVTFDLQKKLVDSGIVTDEIRVPLRNLQAAIEIFHPDNLPLMTKASDLNTEYAKLRGRQNVEWQGEERTISQMRPLQYETDRSTREDAWRMSQERILQDREAFNELWGEFLDLRQQMVANIGMESYREYAWKSRNRHDYTPDDAIQFCHSIEKVVVPALAERRERRRQQLGVEALRPWDMTVDPQHRPPLSPYDTADEWLTTTEKLFSQVDPELGGYFGTMIEDDLLDVENRKGKRSGGYNTSLPVTQKPFILMNAVGLGGDVRTLLHEAGHAFHSFERFKLPYGLQRRSPMEFNEVASMAMELLALPYITEEAGGYFNEADATRYTLDQLEGVLGLWCHMATVVLFQHWIYTHLDEARDPAACDAKWVELRDRFLPGIDWSGLDDYRPNRWRVQLHIFLYPFYYLEYGLARLGSVQIWQNALDDQAAALQSYREALALGGTATLPELFATAGASLSYDEDTLQAAVDLITAKIDELEAVDA